jgi:short-subunit dehydrogenase
VTSSGAQRPVLIPVDLSERGSAAVAAERAVAELGAIDILINNAGSGAGGLQWTVGDGDAARATFETNFWSALALVGRIVPSMRERQAGTIVNVTSVAQVLTLWQLGHYASSKAALALATETLRLELTGSGVQVLEVVVGPTNTAVQGETRLIAGAEEAMGSAPLGDPARLARLIVAAIARRRRRVVYPRVYQPLFTFPAAARVYMPRLAARLYRQGKLDLDDARVVRGGSLGDEIAREARERWERERMGKN